VFRRRIPREVESLVREYAKDKGIDDERALIELVKMGYRGYKLQSAVGYDKMQYFLKVEASYLYYRMRVRELVEQIKSLALGLMGTVKLARTCLERYAPQSDAVAKELEELSKLEELARNVIREFITSIRKDVEEHSVDDEVVIQSLENLIKAYRELQNRLHESSQRVPS